MSTGTDKRNHPRRLLKEEIYCYLDGTRFDAGSHDISAGGLFLKTNSTVPIGSVIALVFKQAGGPAVNPIFLLGMVVRHQTEPVGGIGLQWTRAISSGPALVLEQFLEARMSITGATVVEEAGHPREPSRSVYRFPVGTFGGPQAAAPPSPPRPAPKPEPPPWEPERTHTPPPPPRPAMKAPTRRGFSDASKFLSQHEVAVVRSDGKKEERRVKPLEEHVTKLSDTAEPGPLSLMVRRSDTLPPTNLAARLVVAGRSFDATITGIGLKGMYLRVAGNPPPLGKEVGVLFELPSKGGSVPVDCTCKLLFIDRDDESPHPGLELEVVRYEEKGMKGILYTYLKWLTFRSLKQGQ